VLVEFSVWYTIFIDTHENAINKIVRIINFWLFTYWLLPHSSELVCLLQEKVRRRVSQDDSSKGGSWTDIWGAPTRHQNQKNGKLAHSFFFGNCPCFMCFLSFTYACLVNAPTNTLNRRGGKGESKASSGCSKKVARVLKERSRQAPHVQTSRGSGQQGVRTRQWPMWVSC
jgi:hypothetical protein